MNILITGANGQLGNEMRIISCDSCEKYFFTDVNQVEGVVTYSLDITNVEEVRKFVVNNAIDIIVNCAAYTNVEEAEINEGISERLNAVAPENLAMIMKEVNGLLIHISTDYVFGKEPYNTPCSEEQKGTPTGIYGLTKLHGEQKILATGCNFVIIRTAWLYSEFGNNFCKTMLRLTASKPQLNVVFDQVGTPTYAFDLANAIKAIIEDYKQANNMREKYDKNGIYNFSNEGVCSWFDFAKIIQLYSDSNNKCDIKPCHSDEFPSRVKRPAYSVLDKTKIKRTFGIKIPYWTESLKKCITNIMNY
ncbi:MAG: dTDP-4-dehydrorhamnose reductase [Bacteroidaceae bacterium]|nr:dTDP-4-dehydrorhamnose reductase [Bacteroidaceae bacterium]